MKTYLVGPIIVIVIPASTAADEPPMTRQQADEIVRELHEIRNLLQQPPGARNEVRPPGIAPQKVSMSLENTRFMGSEKAPLTIVEFTDYQCPYCQRFHLTTFTALKEKYIDSGVARFYSRDLPLEMHRNALRAAEAARCAGEQGHFWEMRNLLQSNSDKLELEILHSTAGSLNWTVNHSSNVSKTKNIGEPWKRRQHKQVKSVLRQRPAFLSARALPMESRDSL